MYDYQTERPRIFTESGQVDFLKVRDAARYLLETSGAFRQDAVLRLAKVTGDSWFRIACVDRLVELGEIVELPRQCWAQYKVYTSPETGNY